MAHSEAKCRECLINCLCSWLAVSWTGQPCFSTCDGCGFKSKPCCAEGALPRTRRVEVAGKKPHKRTVSLPQHAELIYVNLETLAEICVLCVETIVKENLELCRGNRVQTENLLKTRGQTSKEPHSSWLIFMHYYGPLRRVCDWSGTLPTGSEVPTTSPASATPDIQELARLTPFENKLYLLNSP